MKKTLVVLRILIGVLFLAAGWTKIINPEWTAAGFLGTAKTFPALYSWFASSANIAWVDFLNQWGLAAIGLSMITGLLVRPAAVGGMLMMALYYFPGVELPYVVEDHIIYIAVFALLYAENAGKYFGLDHFIFSAKAK